MMSSNDYIVPSLDDEENQSAASNAVGKEQDESKLNATSSTTTNITASSASSSASSASSSSLSTVAVSSNPDSSSDDDADDSVAPSVYTAPTDMAENIKVICRFRPENADELALGNICVSFPSNEDDEDAAFFRKEDDKPKSNKPKPEGVSISIENKSWDFYFDRVFRMESTQEDVFSAVGPQTVKAVMDGYNAAVVAYGQTGSGKSHSMLGPGFDGNSLTAAAAMDNDSFDAARIGQPGLIPRIMASLFSKIHEEESNEIAFNVTTTFIEIYMEHLNDLLSPVQIPFHQKHLYPNYQPLKIIADKERGLWIPRAVETEVRNLTEVFGVIQRGMANRKQAATKSNIYSSRSHAIFVVSLIKRNVRTRMTKISQLYLVDLAGSEKLDRTEVQGLQVKEANMINHGLLSLGQVIQALSLASNSKKPVYIPYRNSKLTRLLSNCIGGNSRTTLLVNCSPSSFNDRETLSSLRFADRMKSIKNSAVQNVDISFAELKLLFINEKKENLQLKERIKILENEIKVLKQVKALEAFRMLPPVAPSPPSATSTLNGSNIKLLTSPLAAAAGGDSNSSESTALVTTPSSGNTSRRGSGSLIIIPIRKNPAQENESKEDSNSNTAVIPDDSKSSATLVKAGNEMTEFLLSPENSVLRYESSSASAMDLRSLVLSFMCPLAKEIMIDPVIAMDGVTYEKRAISAHFASSLYSPVTGQKVSSKLLIPNTNLYNQIRTYYPDSIKMKRRFFISRFDSLPIVLLSYIASFLDHRSVVRLNSTNKEWNKVTQDKRIWKALLAHHGAIINTSVLETLDNNLMTYFKTRYRQMHPPPERMTAAISAAGSGFIGVRLIPPPNVRGGENKEKS